jgi:AraC-like DNA-binding protein
MRIINRQSTSSSTIRTLFSTIANIEQWELNSTLAPFWRCYCPLSLGGQVNINNKIITLKPGKAYLVSPMTTGQATNINSFQKIYSHFVLEPNTVNFPSGIFEYVLSTDEYQTLNIFHQITFKKEKNSPLDNILGLRLNLFLTNISTKIIGQIPSAKMKNEFTNTKINQIIILMKNNLTSPLSNKELADHITLHENSFIRLFTQITGQSPQQKYLFLRLCLACELLQDYSLTIEEISESCGFWDRSHFSRSFKQVWYKSPVDYRRINS